LGLAIIFPLERYDSSNCQAQSQFQVKLSLKTELALFSLNPATHTHPQPPHPGKFIFQHFSVKVDRVNLQEYSWNQIGRQPQFCGKWKIEDDLNYFAKWKTISISQFEGKWKTTSICWQLEDDINLW
jgi:hypothetical protein